MTTLVCTCEQCGKNPAEFEFGYDTFDHERAETVRMEILICGVCLLTNEETYGEQKRSYTIMWLGREQEGSEQFVFR